jgi:hypothetical protein
MNALDGKGFVNKLCNLFRASCLWILLGPYVILGLGAVSNQAVLIANHDKFPVMVNARKLDVMLNPSPPGPLATLLGILEPAPKGDKGEDRMIDDIHCVMTPVTHLNFLADIFDLHNATYSIGDLLMILGEQIGSFTPIIWGTLIFKKIWDEVSI